MAQASERASEYRKARKKASLDITPERIGFLRLSEELVRQHMAPEHGRAVVLEALSYALKVEVTQDTRRAERLERLHAVNILRAVGDLRDTRQNPEALIAHWRRLTDDERARLVASYREV